MSLAAASLSTPLTPDEHGVVRIASSRVTLEQIVGAFDAGASAEEIVETYPTLDLGDVYAAIAFIIKNRDAVDAYMADSEVEAERSNREWEERHPTSELRRRIRSRATTG